MGTPGTICSGASQDGACSRSRRADRFSSGVAGSCEVRGEDPADEFPLEVLVAELVPDVEERLHQCPVRRRRRQFRGQGQAGRLHQRQRIHQVGAFDGGHHRRDGALGMRHDVAAGGAPAVVGQGPQDDRGVLGEGRFQRFGHSVKAVAAQEQGVVGQGHAVLPRPGGGAEASGAVHEHYPLLEHDPTLFHGPDIPTAAPSVV